MAERVADVIPRFCLMSDDDVVRRRYYFLALPNLLCLPHLRVVTTAVSGFDTARERAL